MIGRVRNRAERNNLRIGVCGNRQFGTRGNSQGAAVVKRGNVVRADINRVVASVFQNQKCRQQSSQPGKLDRSGRRQAIVKRQRRKWTFHRVQKVEAWIGHGHSEAQVKIGRRLYQNGKTRIRSSALVRELQRRSPTC